MAASAERILLVESDPEISDLIARQALKPLGYGVRIVRDAAAAISEALANPPDLVIANLALPDLSGKDLITALASQGVRSPLVVVAEKGEEKRVIEAFRLGAVDALMWPARDAEVVRVVERALQQTRSVRARQVLDEQLRDAHEELERRVRDLTTMLSISKALISVNDQQELLGRLLDGALQVGQGDIAWILLRDERTRTFLLRAHRNLPWGWGKKVNQPLDDGLSSLVALSGQSLIIHGEPLEKFQVSALGKSAAVMPVKAQDQVIGILIVVRKADREVERNTQTLLEAVADFASIALINARLFQAVESTAGAARIQQQNGKNQLESLRETIREEIRNSTYPLESLISGRPGPVNEEQRQALNTVTTSLRKLARAAGGNSPPDKSTSD